MSKKDEFIKDFAFHIPVELIKSNDGDEGSEDSWKIQGIASTAGEDLQGEIVDQDGLDISLLKAGRGLFNFDHQKGPENVLGQIEDADFLEVNGDKALFVKGYLFKHSERGKAFYNILKSLKKDTQHRVHFSIEGKILKRSTQNPNNIANARVDKVALTFDPVNPVTYCSLVKSLSQMNTDFAKADMMTGNTVLKDHKKLVNKLVNDIKEGNTPGISAIKDPVGKADITTPAKELVEEHEHLVDVLEHGTDEEQKEEGKKQNKELKEYKEKEGDSKKSITLSKTTAQKLLKLAQKAIAAGAGYMGPPGAMTGGAAMTSESLAHKPTTTAYDELDDKKKIKKSDAENVKELIEKARIRYPDVNPLKVAQLVIESYNDQILKKAMKKTVE